MARMRSFLLKKNYMRCRLCKLDGRKFKGFIDLGIKTDDGKYHVIDWKTCSWGWDAKETFRQICDVSINFYKKVFCLKT